MVEYIESYSEETIDLVDTFATVTSADVSERFDDIFGEPNDVEMINVCDI